LQRRTELGTHIESILCFPEDTHAFPQDALALVDSVELGKSGIWDTEPPFPKRMITLLEVRITSIEKRGAGWPLARSMRFLLCLLSSNSERCVLPVNLFSATEPFAGNISFCAGPTGLSVAVKDIVCYADGRMLAKRCLDEGRTDRV